VAADDEVDRLYGLSLEEFTPARNELAKRLRKEGEREQADEVRALAKPSVAAWTVNQLARRRGARVRSLLDAGEALRTAQERALGGSGADELRDAARRERELVTELRREARGLLAESGRPAPDALLERVATTLSNAAVDPDARPLLEAGRLTDEVESSGFGAFAGMAVPARGKARAQAPAKPTAKPAQGQKQTADDRRSRADEERKRAAELRRRARELDREAGVAERKAARAAREAEQATRAARRAEADAASAHEEAARARGAADEARAEADRASP
jgi:hypothetical protein